MDKLIAWGWVLVTGEIGALRTMSGRALWKLERKTASCFGS